MKDLETLGQRMKRLRKEAGLTQEGLAEATGLALPNVRNWEQGYRVPNVFALYGIARAVGRPMEDFLQGVARQEDGRARKPRARSRPKR